MALSVTSATGSKAMPTMMAEIAISAMMDLAKSATEKEMQVHSMMVTAKMKMAAVAEQANARFAATRMAALANANSLMVVVPAGKKGSPE